MDKEREKEKEKQERPRLEKILSCEALEERIAPARGFLSCEHHHWHHHHHR